MHSELKDVSKHLAELGAGILAQAQKNALYTGYYSHLDEGVFGVMQAAQAAELLIKAAIAKQHPLLIFSSVPKSTSVSGELLSMQDIFEDGKTIQYAELPEKLWATTGYKLPNQDIYKSFGKLRNTIQHFALPKRDMRAETARFIYAVVDPLMGHFWDDYAVNYVDVVEAKDDIFELLSNYGIKPRYPEELKDFAESVE